MEHRAKILADSVSPDGVRLTTMEGTFPRIVLSEFNTHRMLSRNSASSRAIPVEKMIKMVDEHPYVPTHWGKNQKGMQADEELNEEQRGMALEEWSMAKNAAIQHAQMLMEYGVHKQITNRLLEPFMWHTVIVTATEWDNFFHLRCHRDAHPEIRRAAELMRDAMAASEPKVADYNSWHLPLVGQEDAFTDLAGQIFAESLDNPWLKVSVGRCARVSYLTHEGKRDPQADVELADRLLASGHMSPFEHVARPMTVDELRAYSLRKDALDHDKGTQLAVVPFCGNLRGWVQYRKMIPGEADILGARS